MPIGVGLISLRYGLPGKPGAAPLPNVIINPVALTLHAVPAALTLIAVPFQLHIKASGRVTGGPIAE